MVHSHYDPRPVTAKYGLPNTHVRPFMVMALGSYVKWPSDSFVALLLLVSNTGIPCYFMVCKIASQVHKFFNVLLEGYSGQLVK